MGPKFGEKQLVEVQVTVIAVSTVSMALMYKAC